VFLLIGRNWFSDEYIEDNDYLLSDFIDRAIPAEDLRTNQPDQLDDYLSYFIDRASHNPEPPQKSFKKLESGQIVNLQQKFISGFSSLDRSLQIELVRVSRAHMFPSSHEVYMPDAILMYYTLGGEGEVYYNKQSFHCRKYDCVCFSGNEYANLRALPGPPWETVCIDVHGSFKPGSIPYINDGELSFMTFGAGSRFRSIIWDLLSPKIESNSNKDSLHRHLLLSLFLEMDMALTMSADKPTIVPVLILAIQDYLDKNYSKDISLDSLAKTFNISKYHMSREFKRYISKSPIDYLIDVRIKRAKSLLYESNRSIAEICQLVGIANPNHFLYLFKEREGMTPSAFRKFKF